MRDRVRTELPLAALMMAAQRQRPAEGLNLSFQPRQPIRIGGVRQAAHCNESQTVNEPDRLLLR